MAKRVRLRRWLRLLVLSGILLSVGCTEKHAQVLNERQWQGCYNADIQIMVPGTFAASGSGVILTGGMTADDCNILRQIPFQRQ